MKKTQVAIIGGGPGGYVTAIRLNQMGIDTILFEKERLGGVCLNWGCIPTKTLIKSSDLSSEIKNAKKFGLEVNDFSVNYKTIFKRTHKVKNQLIAGIEYLFKKRNIEVINEKAALIKKQEGFYIIQSKKEDVKAQFVIIATGSRPKRLPNLNFDNNKILSSKDLLKLEKLPKKLAVIGGGVIGCEFASIFSQLGAKVEIIEFLPSLLNQEDEEIANRLKIALKKQKIKVHLNTEVMNCKNQSSGIKLICDNDKVFETEIALLSVGRVPQCNMEFANSKLELEENAIRIDKNQETSLTNVFAIGDVTAKLLLAHTASKQGILAADVINNRINKRNIEVQPLNYNYIPRCTYTNPEVASVGLTEEKAREQYTSIKVGKFNFRANGKALGIGETYGFVKTIAASSDDKLLGMHIIGPSATELIATGTVLIQAGVCAKKVEKIVFAHPTLSETIMESIEDINSRSIHKI